MNLQKTKLCTHWVWLSGWAIPPEIFLKSAQEAFPHTTHTCVPPTPRSLTQALEHYPEASYFGHSLGAFLLLKTKLPCTLLCPFIDFKKESDFGGTVSKTQLKYLLRWLDLDPVAAINDFYKRAGLPLTCKAETLPYPIEDLKTGIEILLQHSFLYNLPIPEYVRAYFGGQDPLFEKNKVGIYFKNAIFIEGAGHHYEAYFPKINQDVFPSNPT